MKLGQATKLDKENTTTPKKKIDDDAMSEKRDAIVNFFDLWPILSILEDGFRTDFINSNFLSYENRKQT